MRPHLLQDTTLRYFLAVAQSGSLTEASARLHVAASALSRQIAGLEAQLGSPLFERHPRGMVLTAAGEILAAQGRKIAFLFTELKVNGTLALVDRYVTPVAVSRPIPLPAPVTTTVLPVKSMSRVLWHFR